ncbi:hypothetical protein ASG90_17075 [Nocardioides sp. Soil797]|nr:hypothetical protein ASG90_17075 [Nocardioides sp. Soil797]
MPPAPRPASWAYRPELDGLRTFAVVIIIFYHSRVDRIDGAFIALDLFFVLSGFLVTNVVMTEIDQRGTLDLGRYYARRVRRLLPAAVVAILGICLLFVLVSSEPQRVGFVRQGQAALVYLANWQFIAEANDYFVADATASPFMHFWSLSVEEQYYIFFPLLILMVHRMAPGRGRVLLGVLGVLIALSITSQVVSAMTDPIRAYYATDARLYQLLAGAALAIALREFVKETSRGDDGSVSWPRLGPILSALGLVGYFLLGSELLAMPNTARNLLATLLALAMICGLYTSAGSLLSRVFGRPTPVYLGKISYGTYLWHWPMILVVGELFTIRPVAVAVLSGIAATALASLSYHVLETPIRRTKWLDRLNWRAVGAGLAISVLAAVFAIQPVLSSSRAPVVAASTEEPSEVVQRLSGADSDKQLRKGLGDDVDLAAVVEDKGPDDVWCGPENPDDCTLVDGGGAHVMLVGDSHARMLAPGLIKAARKHDLKLSAKIVPGCPWAAGVYNGKAPGKSKERCFEAGKDFYTKTVPAVDPDVVVVANYDRGEKWQGRLVDEDDNDVAWPRQQFRAIERTADLLAENDTGLVMVKSILGTGGWSTKGPDPLDCLARAKKPGKCKVVRPTEDAFVDGLLETTAALHDNAATVDLNPLICPDGLVCSPVRDGYPVWRNQNHLAGRTSEALAEPIWELVEGTELLGKPS